MKQFLYSILFILISSSCFGQTLFFENLNQSSWTSDLIKNEVQFSNSTEIHLSKLKVSKDSIIRSVSIFTFKDSILTITNYDFKHKTETLIGNYNYKTPNYTLIVSLNDSTQLDFGVGIISTGSFATLYRSFEKKTDFTIKIDIENATKDGLYINGYVINIPYDKIEELNGKTVNIKGKVSIVKPNSIDRKGRLQQGRETITKYIFKPKIKVIE